MGAETGLAMFCGMIQKIKPYLAMVSLQFGYAGMYIITMLCLKKGMNHYVLAVYRHVVATIVITPFAIVLERFAFYLTKFHLMHVGEKCVACINYIPLEIFKNKFKI